LKPCIYVATSVVDFAVDVLCLVLDLIIYIVGFAECIVQDILSIVDDCLFRLFNVLEDLCVGNDES
jgi:hypothetical protein